MTRIQLVCTDLDGVLLTSAGDLTHDTRTALAEARAAGLQVMVAPGPTPSRPISSAAPLPATARSRCSWPIPSCRLPGSPARLAGGAVTGLRATFSTAHFLEISPEHANKGQALRWAAAHRRIPLAATAAVGDMPNDLPMLRQAGLPAAVANAHPEVKAAARILLPSNDDDGVASLIRTILR